MAAKRKRELLSLKESPGIPSPPDYLILDCTSPLPIESPPSIGKTDVNLRDEGFNEIIPLTMNGRRIKDDDWSPMQVSPGVSSGYISEPSPSAYLPMTNGREDVSSTCLNAYSPDTVSDSKKKKGSSSRQQEELCLVCGDRASGYHYNALTCEGCKGFFRRSITKSAVYQCKYGGACDIDMYMRRKCQECRLRKCLAVGMRPECVVPEAQCKPKTKPKPKDKDKPNSTTREATLFGDMSGSFNSPINENKLTTDQDELIKKLVFCQGQYELPHEDDIKKLTQFTFTGNQEIDQANRFQHVAELTILTVQLVVESTKRLPGFETLKREDQITLLKACSSEVMMLRTARRYDLDLDCVVFANNMPYTRENYKVASVGDCTDATFDFCKTMANLKVANAEYALLTAIVVFSERPNLVESKKVEKIQEVYLDALRNYVETHRPKGSNIFAKLLMKLTELRSLGNDYSEMLFSLKLQNQALPPLLMEVMDYSS